MTTFMCGHYERHITATATATSDTVHDRPLLHAGVLTRCLGALLSAPLTFSGRRVIWPME